MKIGSTVLLLIPYRFHIIFEPARLRIACRQVRLSVCQQAGTPADRSAGKLDGRQVGARAGLQASVCMSARICIHENPHAGRLAGIHTDITTLLIPLISSFLFFFWAAWASGNDALKAEITAQIPIRLLTDY